MATKNIDIIVTAKDNASKAFTTLWDTIQKNLKTIKIASGVVAWWLTALWKKFLDAAIENEPLQRSFERLSESAWIASKDMLQAMRKASQWTVADTQLMASANKAYALWIVKNTEDMATMIEVARLKWQAMWRTMEEALDDITTWLWRGSAQILDNLWIVVNAEEANEKYAQSIWKVAKELTDEEKKQALVNAVVEQWKKELAEAWEVQLTMQEKIAKLNTQWENTKNTIGDALIPVLDKLLTAITPIIEKIAKWIEENPELTSNILLITTAVAGLTFWLTTILPVITSVVAIMSWPAWWIVACAWVVAGLKVLDSQLKTNQEKADEYRAELVKLHEEYEAGLIPLDEYTVKSWLLEAQIDELEAKHRTLWWYISDNFISTIHSMMDPMDEQNWWLRAWIDLLEMLWSWINNTAKSLKDVLMVALDWVIAKMKSLRDRAVKVANKISEFAGSARNTVSWRVDSAKSLVWFANGWSVQGNVPILVWERWPEVFVPNNSGRIIPNSQITNNNWVEINLNWVSVRNDSDIQSITDEIIRKIKLEKNFWIA